MTIIGVEPAGLNAALVLGRARKKVTIIDGVRMRGACVSINRGLTARIGLPDICAATFEDDFAVTGRFGCSGHSASWLRDIAIIPHLNEVCYHE